MNNQRKTLFVSSMLAIAVATGIAITSGQDQKHSPSTKRSDATPIQEGVMTERQRQHSKLYERGAQGRKLRDFDRSVEISITVPWGNVLDEYNKKSPEEFLCPLANQADAIVVGVVKNRSSQLTTDGTSVFTDYGMTVEEVFKDNPKAQIRLNEQLVITRPGGAVELSGKVFRVWDRSFKRLESGGKYLFFLRFIPTTGAYQQLNSRSAFELTQNKINKLTEEEFAVPLNQTDLTGLAAQVRGAVSR